MIDKESINDCRILFLVRFFDVFLPNLFVNQMETITFARNQYAEIMSKMTDSKQKLIQYVHDTLAEDVLMRPIKKGRLDTLPLNILSIFTFYEAEMLGKNVVFVFEEDGDAVPPVQVKRMLEIVSMKLERTVVLITCKIASYNVQRLVHQKVNLIIPGKQMFLPELLINLRRDVKVNQDLKEVIPPLAQVIILHHIEVATLDGKSAQEISSLFDVSYATANRAVRWLATHGLCSLAENSRTKSLHFNQSNKELWEVAKPLLASPVEKTLYTDEQIHGQLVCGINALSEYSMLVGEQREWHAVTREELAKLQIKTDEQFGSNIIEVWRYKPTWLTKKNIVDRLSLYLSLRDNEDERVQMELDNMISSMTW